jgi:hypothetical protein
MTINRARDRERMRSEIATAAMTTFLSRTQHKSGRSERG